ncbi:MAG: phosphotransferase family protein [Ilumatobacteraceae bacterium]
MTPEALPMDLAALASWMDEHGVGDGDLTDTELLPGGTQNILVRFTRGTERYVLRHPPLHKRTNSDESIRREARVLRELGATDVPHPRLIASEPDESVLGSSFFLMADVVGFNPTVDVPESIRCDAAFHDAIGFAMIDALVALARVDVTAELAALGRTGDWVSRQLTRWTAQLASYTGSPGYEHGSLDVDVISDWLGARRPETTVLGLTHGDLHFANVLVDPNRPVLAAVVDWELATIGDPLIDLAHMLVTWPGRTDSALKVGFTALPARAALLDRYSAATRRPLEDLPWFEVLASLRLAVLLEGTHVRAAKGEADAETGRRLHAMAVDLVDLAHDIIERNS